MHVVVIGAGIVGASTALELVEQGHRVSIMEPEQPGGRHAASYGNSGWISPASIIPMSMPGLWKKVPGYLADPGGPLAIRWPYLASLAPWLARFVAAGSTATKVTRTARILSGLLHDAPTRHQALAEKIGRGDLVTRKGLIYAYPDRHAFEAEAFAWQLRRDNGVAYRELSGAELHELEPDLAPRYTFAAYVEKGGHCVDPGGYVAAIVDHAVTLGAERIQMKATGFRVEKGRLQGVVTESGSVPCDRAVIAAGIHSKTLAAQAGDTVPLQSERGYHVVIPRQILAGAMPVMPGDGKMGNNPTLAGLRIAGQVELASVAAAPDWRRADILLRHAASAYPAISHLSGTNGIDRWMGHRPSIADGLPVIGPSSVSNDIIHAFGHGHIGLATGPVTGKLASDLIAERETTLEISSLSAARFRK
ncbi:NAD(P)/FAD-dependent oxidoreductase [Rhizobium sp. SL42]|uniref:NAD(P)/FAD-dependent oxidoreductase n=1 Tax=Rhizobium sp. SL42 TaxID=2806346 RepID=UPI001F27E62B|nr:FAD-binding oxidoreductase [Rhizobium sp. SL42]UJW73804.1 FAD-binding oxidoreductase [Rhizobium sp. SL42]